MSGVKGRSGRKSVPGWPQVPAGFADQVRRMREAGDYPTLSAVLREAVVKGWPAAALARVLGMTRQAVGYHVAHAAVLPLLPVAVPDVPPRPLPPPRPVRQPVHVDPVVAERLRALAPSARSVNGAMPTSHPARQDSVQMTLLLAQEHRRGVTIVELAQVIGISSVGVRKRLARHGHLTLSPSEHHIRYKGRRTWDHPAGGDGGGTADTGAGAAAAA